MKLSSFIYLMLFITAGVLFTLRVSQAKAPASKMNPNITSTQPSEKMPATAHLESIVLGAGCFWGAEKRYQAIPGVVNAISGYAGGQGVSPTYREITQYRNKMNPNNHAEVVQVIFNRSQVSLETILKNYFEGHDPTQLNRQGNDVGTQYRSIILTSSDEQAKIAERIKREYQTLLTEANYGKIQTIIEPLKQFYPAEEYHQDYLVKNPNGYCPDHSTGVTFNKKTTKELIVDNSALLTGKQIVVIDSASFCPYCEKFKEQVANEYQGTIPMSFRHADQLQGLTIKTETWATPTILFLEQGKEVFGHRGFMTSDEFYKVLGAFKLGNSEAFNVAFNKGTDGRFCKQYDIFKNTPDGVFVDKLSGAALFDTRDRFNSGSGWLSFTHPVDGSVIELPDNSHGMSRIEIRSKSSGIHLGHVFPDGPNGQSRYCINATVLEFVPRSEFQS